MVRFTSARAIEITAALVLSVRAGEVAVVDEDGMDTARANGFFLAPPPLQTSLVVPIDYIINVTAAAA